MPVLSFWQVGGPLGLVVCCGVVVVVALSVPKSQLVDTRDIEIVQLGLVSRC